MISAGAILFECAWRGVRFLDVKKGFKLLVFPTALVV
jgi:hypothetical protein